MFSSWFGVRRYAKIRQPRRRPSSRAVEQGRGLPQNEADNSASRVLEVDLCPVGPAGRAFTLPHQILALRAFPCVVGRHSGCDHQLACPAISRRHCAFSVRGGRVWVEDLGSRHGTRLNGQPVAGLQPLHDGDRLDLAFLPFRVRLRGRSGPARM